MACAGCGPRLELVDWLGRHARATRRLAEIGPTCGHLHPRRGCWFGLDRMSVEAIELRCLERTLG